MSEDTNRGGRLRKGRTLAERRQERREALLAAALDLFSSQGYTATPIEEICRTAYVSTRNFYEEFDNREQVLIALGEQIVADVYTALIEGTRAAEDGPRELRAEMALRALAHALLDDPRRARVAFIESGAVSPLRGTRRARIERVLAPAFAAILLDDPADFDPHDRRTIVFLLGLVGAITEVLADWVRRPDRCEVDDLVEPMLEVTDALAAGLALSDGRVPQRARLGG